MVYKGRYSKNIPKPRRNVLCEQFGKALHIPTSIIALLQSGTVSIDQLDGLSQSAIGAVKSISEDEIVNTFSHFFSKE